MRGRAERTGAASRRDRAIRSDLLFSERAAKRAGDSSRPRGETGPATADDRAATPLRDRGHGIFVGLGLLLGVGTTLLLRSQFYQVRAVEWTVLLPVSVAMLAVSAAVAYVSARPWLRINPMEAVRHA